jgi:hypothetical protein
VRRAFAPGALLAAVWTVAVLQPISATVVVSLGLVQLVQGADTIVAGRVVAVSPVRVEGQFTDSLITIEPEAVLKGDARSAVVFRVPGGDVGRYRTIVVGAPVLRLGDDVVVFLAGSAPQIPHVVGFNQGVLPIMRDDRGRALLLAPAVADGAGASRAAGGRGEARVMTLPAFAEDVRAIVERRAGAAGGRTGARPGKRGPGGAGWP